LPNFVIECIWQRDMKINTRVRAAIPILLVAALVLLADLAVMPILQAAGYVPAQIPTAAVLIWDFGFVLVAGLAGLFLAPRVGSPIWWRQGDSSRTSRRATLFPVVLGLVVVAYNSLSVVGYTLAHPDQMAALAAWSTALTPRSAIVLAFRAALNEEIVFRLFLFPLVAWIAGRLMRSRRIALVIGALASAFAFGLIHPGFFAAFVVGLAFVYIYYRRGLLPAMIVHFFADAIPYTLVSLMP
jgi:membrane protease YdiL (CAAX protease family)